MSETNNRLLKGFYDCPVCEQVVGTNEDHKCQEQVQLIIKSTMNICPRCNTMKYTKADKVCWTCNSDILVNVFTKIKNSFPDNPESKNWGIFLFQILNDQKIVMESRSYYRMIYDHTFAINYFGKQPMYLIDISPEWAYDFGDTKTAWVNAEALKLFCKSELKAFEEEHKVQKGTDAYDILTMGIESKWENPFDFAISELEEWKLRLQQMVISDEPILFLEKYL